MVALIALPSSLAGEKRHCLTELSTCSSREESVDLWIDALSTCPDSSMTTLAETMPEILFGFFGATLFVTAGGSSHFFSSWEWETLTTKRAMASRAMVRSELVVRFIFER